ncbi:anti sigma factor C-terminal domain-containing protein [Paenibacillus uliginis]|nr:anti sigma factor C-terminal domain-containing protein [Paenibacillus uliginis]
MRDEFESHEQDVLRDEDFDTEPPKWSKKKFNRMIWRTRVKMLVNAASAMLLLFLLYTVYISAIHIYFDTTDVRGKFIRSIITVVELHEDGVKVEKPANPTIEVTPFLTQKTTLKLYRDVGKWQVITGEIRVKQSLLGKLTYSIENTGAYMNNDSQAAFILPSSIMFDKNDLEQLRKIEDGNVAELSFSINTLMSPEQLMEMLDSYDIAVTGMPVYAGELKDFDTPHTVGGGTDYYVPHLTLRPMSVFEENNKLSMWQLYFSAEDKGRMSEHIDYMMSDLNWMTTNIRYYGVDQDKQRLAYLQKNGVQVYGATVTGPVRELEKLKEQPEFREFRLGRIEVWNWEERS